MQGLPTASHRPAKLTLLECASAVYAVSVSSAMQDSNLDHATTAGADGGALELSGSRRVAGRQKEGVNDEHGDGSHSKDVSPSAESIRQGILEASF